MIFFDFFKKSKQKPDSPTVASDDAENSCCQLHGQINPISCNSCPDCGAIQSEPKIMNTAPVSNQEVIMTTKKKNNYRTFYV